MWGALLGTVLSIDKGYKKLICEMDSQLALHLITKNCGKDHPLSPLFLKIRMLLNHFDDVKFVHVFREGNCLADVLANHGHSLQYGQHIFDRPPSFCSLVLHDDIRKSCLPRSPPKNSFFKLNIDGFAADGKLGAGRVIRNAVGFGSALHAEFWAFQIGLQMAIDQGIKNLEVETDALSLYNFIMNPNIYPHHKYFAAISNCKHLIL
ncbi:putative ribonuclease H-like domain-containing protein [Senna tora]|uniref:Putative ribonuclease H-like domain-containing protein n=1 Tax=Senna tora TaxID=362788 RepID=A0A834WZS9_9FABA|nr:putative ribonuclease H-like domain-containing protein [Senna tora]